MAVPNLSDEQLRVALKELEEGSYNHQKWVETLYGAFICRLPPDEQDVSRYAHHRCRFGQWYYGPDTVAFRDYPGFAEIGSAHERMHHYAANLLRRSTDGVPISIADYERLETILKRLIWEICSVQHEFERWLFNPDPSTRASSGVEMLSKLREQQEFVRRGRPCVVAMMDLDHFKSVNDQYGDLVGDKVLIDFAHHIMAHLHSFDKVFRYGSEGFLICLADTDLETGHAVIDRLRQELAALMFESNGKGAFHVTASFGVTALVPDIAVERSIDRAEKALYAAKTSGRDRVVDWSDSMNGLVRRSPS